MSADFPGRRRSTFLKGGATALRDLTMYNRHD